MSYEEALTRARKQKAKADDAAQMAGFCADALQLAVGAVSPKLVWQGAQAKGLTYRDLVSLAVLDAPSVAELQWL